MKELIYVTGNAIKFHQANAACEPFGIQLLQSKQDIQEVQAETGDIVARDKAQKAFEILRKPVVISDDSWAIPGLGGFPGPYMKYINDWFSPQDFLRLTSQLEDRRMILCQVVVYQDADVQKLFTANISGILLKEIRGKSVYPHATITSLDGGKHSNAEYHERGESAAEHHHSPWHDLAEWYAAKS